MAPNVVTRVAFKNILFATDFSDVSQHALMHALTMAKRYEAKLTVIHVAPPETQSPIPMEPTALESDWQKKKAAESLAKLEDFEPLHMYPHETVLKQGNPWPEMSGTIDDKGFDLIVLGTHGRGLIGTVFLGSVAEQVLRHATCPASSSGLTWWLVWSTMSSCRTSCLPPTFPKAPCTPFPMHCRWQRRTMPN